MSIQFLTKTDSGFHTVSSALKNKANKLEKFQDVDQISDWAIDQAFNSKLNKLKKSNSDAFFYWYQVYLLKTKAL